MATEILDRVTQRVRVEFDKQLPPYVRKLRPLPEDLFPPETELRSLHIHDSIYIPCEKMRKFFLELNLDESEQCLVMGSIAYLAFPRVMKEPVFDEPITIDLARKFVAKGLLEYFDEFRNDRLQREVIKRILGI